MGQREDGDRLVHLHLFNFLYRIRDLRARLSTRRRAGFSCATLFIFGCAFHITARSTHSDQCSLKGPIVFVLRMFFCSFDLVSLKTGGLG